MIGSALVRCLSARRIALAIECLDEILFATDGELIAVRRKIAGSPN
jgi:hypothetical protein